MCVFSTRVLIFHAVYFGGLGGSRVLLLVSVKLFLSGGRGDLNVNGGFDSGIN